MSAYPEVATAVAPVYVYGSRRFLTKRAAFAAKARDMMRGGEHHLGEYDMETGVSDPCQCFACDDGRLDRGDSGPAHKAITRALMRGEQIPAEYAERLPEAERCPAMRC